MANLLKTFKGAVKSKTVIFNVLFILVLIANSLGFSEFEPDGTIAVIGNLIIRLMTTKPLWEK